MSRTMKKTATVGVYRTAQDTFLATIGNKHLGTYQTLDEAAEVRRQAAEQRGTFGKSATQFQPNRQKAGGRAKGTKNLFNSDLKERILRAAARSGYNKKGLNGLDGYLKRLADEYPKQYTSLIGKIMPLQIVGSLHASIGAVNIVPVPSGRFLSQEEVAAQLAPATEPIVIDAPSDQGNVVQLRGDEDDHATR